MKTLSNYVVKGGLKRPNGDDAQVGDSVRLYLDTVANPDFPSTIIGEIVYPIAPTNCGQDKAYSIEFEAEFTLRACDVVDAVVLDCCTLLEENKANINADNIIPFASSWRENIGVLPTIIEPAATFITNPIDPLELTFKKVKQSHKVSPIDENFIVWDEDFESGSTLCFEGGENPSALTEKGIFYPVRGESYVADTGKSDNPAGANNSGLFRIPFLVSCVDVVSRAGSADDAINVGFNISRFPDTPLYIVQARYSPVTNQAAIFFLNNGVGTTVGAASYTATYPFEFALTIGDKSAAAWIKEEGKDWVLAARGEFPDGFDITDPDVFERLQPSLYTAVTPGETETWAISRFRAGYAGNIGIANQAFIRFEDGTPVIKDNKAFFVANANIASATGGAFSEINLSANCVSIFSIDLATYKTECVSKLNTVVAGLFYGQNSGCIVYDRTTGTWICLIPNWASKNTDAGSTFVYFYETKDDILHGIHVLENGVRVMLPGDTSQYDPDIVKIEGVWHCIYAATNTLTGWSEYYSTLAKLTSGSNFDPEGTWELIGQNTETVKAEGQKLQKIGGQWYGLGYFEGLQIYSFEDMSTVATVEVPYENPLINNHPNIMHVTRGGKTSLLWVGWLNDAYEGQALSWGSVQIMESNQFQIGREFPRVRLPWSE